MADSVVVQAASLKERLREMRVRREASNSSARSTRSPSAKLPSTPETYLSSGPTLPMRAPEVMMLDGSSRAPLGPSNLRVHREMSVQLAASVGTVGEARVGLEEYIVPLPMHGRVSEQYQQTIYNQKEDIENFVRAEGWIDPTLLGKMEDLVHRLNDITNHPDLVDETVADSEPVSPETEANWAENCTAKFTFLRQFLEILRTDEMNVAIFVQGGQLLDIVETFLKGFRFNYNRPDKHRGSGSSAKGSLMISLIPTGDEGGSVMASPASLVIAFDSSFNPNHDQVRHARAHLINVDEICPVIYLIIPYTIEHIDLCIPKNMAASEHLQVLVSCATQLRNDIGQLPDDSYTHEEAPELVASFLRYRPDSEWPLPSIQEVDGVELVSETQQEESGLSVVAENSGPTREVTPGGLPSNKRQLTADEEEHGPLKRMRSTPVPERVPLQADTEITHSSETAGDRPLRETASGGTPEDENVDRLTKLQKSISRLEETANPLDAKTIKARILAYKTEKETIERDLRDRIKYLDSRVQEHVDALTDLQTRFEERTQFVLEATKERDEAVVTTILAERRKEAQIAEIASLKEDRARLESELAEARNSLVNSTIPDAAELEKARTEAREATSEKGRLEHRLKSLIQDFEFTRQQYQSASTAAAEAVSELSELKEKLVVLERKASGEALKCQAFTRSQMVADDQERIRELESTLEDREELIRRKDEELRFQARGRGLATRATSVPRSPKLSSRAMSPNPGFLIASGQPSEGRGGHPLRYG